MKDLFRPMQVIKETQYSPFDPSYAKWNYKEAITNPAQNIEDGKNRPKVKPAKIKFSRYFYLAKQLVMFEATKITSM